MSVEAPDFPNFLEEVDPAVEIHVGEDAIDLAKGRTGRRPRFLGIDGQCHDSPETVAIERVERVVRERWGVAHRHRAAVRAPVGAPREELFEEARLLRRPIQNWASAANLGIVLRRLGGAAARDLARDHPPQRLAHREDRRIVEEVLQVRAHDPLVRGRRAADVALRRRRILVPGSLVFSGKLGSLNGRIGSRRSAPSRNAWARRGRSRRLFETGR